MADLDFSVIIPALNAEQTLSRCLNSIWTTPPARSSYEVIVVDDGSQDGTGLILHELASERQQLTVVPFPETRGPGAARNAALDIARGRIVVFLDADDALAGGALDELAAAFEGDGDVDVVTFSSSVLGVENDFDERNDAHYFGDRATLLDAYLRHKMDGSPVLSAYRRTPPLDTLRFADGIHEDVDFMFMLYDRAHHVRYLPQQLYQKSIRSDSLSGTISPAHIDGYFRAWRAIGNHVLQSSNDDHIMAFQSGAQGAIASRVLLIFRLTSNPSDRRHLLEHLVNQQDFEWLLKFGNGADCNRQLL